MTRGIYITANDKVTEQAIALLNSIRHYDKDTPITLIPFDDNSDAIAKLLREQYGVKLYEDLDFMNRLARKLYEIFGEGFFNTPNKLRKQACWFGEFDEFLYIDTDVVVFDKIVDNLKYLQEYDFLCYDYQHVGGIKNVFTPKIFTDGVLKEKDIQGIFNSGWWASKNNLFSEQDLYDIFKECNAHPEYFDFSQKTTDQPILNYIILTHVPRHFNIVHRPEQVPGSWAGSPQFKRRGDILFDPNCDRALQYLHWAGIRIEPGCPYWDIWKHYRYLHEKNPPQDPFGQKWKRQGQRLLQNLKQKLKGKVNQ